MKIDSIEACTCVLPVQGGVAIATRSLTERHYMLVRVRTDTGIDGLGFCYVGNRAGSIATLAVRELLRDVVIGRDAHQAESIWDAMYRESLLQGRRGSVLRAISAIDVAIWDAVSKEAGLPLYRYLGAYHEGTVPVYASGGYYGENKTLVDLSTEMIGYVEMGFTAVKMKVGMLPMSEDVERVKTARETLGPDIPLFLDANNAWPDSVSAIQAIRAFEPYNPGWIEEPLMPDDIRGHARITDAVDTPVATGEIHATRWEFLDLIEREAAQVIQPDAGVCGGITEWRRIAGIAASHAIPVAPHWLADLHAHLVAATPNATWVEYFTDFSVLNLGMLFDTALEMADGRLLLPDRPGLGVVLNNNAVHRYSVDGWG